MKTVLITGCSSGFGRGMVDEFLRRDWHVIATLRNAEQRQEILSAPLADYDHRLTILSLDVTNPAERQSVQTFIQEQGQLDCLVNNAGNCILGAAADLSETQIRQQLETNFFGAVLLTRSLLPYLHQAQGSIICLSSTFGYLGFPLTSAYCASKFALEGWAESLYHELKPHGIRVTVIQPGASKTNFGQNVEWAEQSTEPYRRQTKNFLAFKQRLSTNAQDNTAQVARVVANAAERKAPRFRIRIGQDAIATHWFKALTPEWLQLELLSRFFDQTFWQKT